MTLVRIYAALAVGMWLMACTGPAPDERPVLIPAPQKTIWGDGTYRLPERLQLGIADTALIAAAGYVNEVLAPYGTVAVDRCDRGDIVLELDSAALPPEGYRLSVTHAGVRIGGGSYRGVVNGIATLRQLLPAKAGSGAKIPYAEIADRPAFGWRGVMLDVSRHFFDKEEIFTLLDQMARLKLNKFHWHLTDDQGWRIEIPCYPELTQEGAWRLFNRQDTLCMGRAAREQNDDFLLPVRRLRTDGADTLYGGYYTRKDIREVVAYAAVRGIDVIPEIDMPGHCLQAIDSYPWLACFGRGSWGQSFSSPLCVGKDRTLAFCESVWEELFELFPYEYVHMGGDEVDKSNWKRCPDCQTRMRAEGLPDEAALQAWFMHRMQRFCEARGRRMIGWDEILEGGAVPGATVMWWRPWEPQSVSAATRQGCEVVLCPQSWFYFSLEEDANCTAPQKLDTFGVFFMKYNYEIRLKAVKLVLEGGLSVREAGCHLGCGRSQVHLWVTLFERHGLAGLKLRHGSYSAEFKLSVLKHMHQNHLSLLETAVHFGIPGPFVIRQWERLYQNQGAEGLRRKPQRRRPAMSKSKTKKVKLKTTPHEELLKELEYLRAENAYLKKLQALVEERIVRESGKEPKPSKD